MINREPIRPLLISSLLDYLTRQIYKAYEDPFHLKLKSFLKDPTFNIRILVKFVQKATRKYKNASYLRRSQ